MHHSRIPLGLALGLCGQLASTFDPRPPPSTQLPPPHPDSNFHLQLFFHHRRPHRALTAASAFSTTTSTTSTTSTSTTHPSSFQSLPFRSCDVLATSLPVQISHLPHPGQLRRSAAHGAIGDPKKLARLNLEDNGLRPPRAPHDCADSLRPVLEGGKDPGARLRGGQDRRGRRAPNRPFHSLV